jgi:hypothetical protein
MSIEIYFVRDGWLNGIHGERALTCGIGCQQADGWYYLLPEMDDGEGPYNTEVDARTAATYAILELTD